MHIYYLLKKILSQRKENSVKRIFKCIPWGYALKICLFVYVRNYFYYKATENERFLSHIYRNSLIYVYICKWQTNLIDNSRFMFIFRLRNCRRQNRKTNQNLKKHEFLHSSLKHEKKKKLSEVGKWTVKIKSNDSFYFSFSSVQLTETSTSAKLNVLLDATSPLLSYIRFTNHFWCWCCNAFALYRKVSCELLCTLAGCSLAKSLSY